MSLFWRKYFGDYALMLKNFATGLIRLCNCCPCVKWNIVSLCPCGDCNSTGPCFVGSEVVVGENQETGEYGPSSLVVDVKAITMVDHGPDDPNATGGVEGGSVNAWNCVRASSGCILWAIKHSTNEAPFDCLTTGSVDIDVSINETSVATWSGHVGSGLSIDIGDGVNGNQYGADILEIDPDADHTGYTFSSAGEYRVDLLVTFNPDNLQLEPVKYTCRTVVNITEQPNTVDWIGQPFIVEDVTDFEGVCPWYGLEPTTLMDMRMYSHVLKGAFDTKEDAEYVLENFAGIIDAYAGTCVCDACEMPYGAIGLGQEVEAGTGEWEEIIELAGDNKVAPAGCVSGWMVYENWCVTLYGSGFTIRLEVSDGQGGWTVLKEISAPGSDSVSGMLKPCQYARATINRSSSASGSFSFGGDRYPLVQNTGCALSDPESPYFEAIWDYDMETHEGVPSNTIELEDYKASLSP